MDPNTGSPNYTRKIFSENIDIPQSWIFFLEDWMLLVEALFREFFFRKISFFVLTQILVFINQNALPDVDPVTDSLNLDL